MRKTVFAFFTILSFGSYSQSVNLFSTDFESGTTMTFDNNGVNTWRVASCAGNGPSLPGVSALYASKGGAQPGCGTDGEDQYAFSPAPPSATERMIASIPIDGTCTKAHAVTFDYKLNTADPDNVAFVMYSLNNGAFWFIQDTIPGSAGWTTISVNLNQSTNNNEFLVGIGFEYRGNSGSGDPIAVDNFSVSGIPAIANIALDTMALCGQTTTVITADDYFSGTGQWTLVSGQGILTNSSAPAPGVNNLGIGTSIFAWTVTSAECGTTSDTIVVINSLAPSAANVQDTMFACGVEQLNISTSTPISGTGMWSSPHGMTISNPNSPVTTLTNMPNGWSQVVWTISAPGCPSNSDTMNIFRVGGQAILTADTTICYGSDPVVLIEATPTDSLQTFGWVFASGGGFIHSPDSSKTEVSGLMMGENRIIYTVTHALCPKESDTLLINITPCDNFEPVFPTVITPNGDGKNDLFIVHNLEKIYPNCQMTIYNRWGNVVFESTGYANPWDGTHKGEKLPMGGYFFKLELNDGQGTVYNGSISIIH